MTGKEWGGQPLLLASTPRPAGPPCCLPSAPHRAPSSALPAPSSRYKNIDKLVHYLNQDGRINAFYSTPAK